MSTTYTVNFQNNSLNFGSVCLYQQTPPQAPPGTMSLAWFAKTVPPMTVEVFEWTTDYQFVWAETGALVPGVRFNPVQMLDADLSTSNQIIFTGEGGVYRFKDQTRGASEGRLYMRVDSHVQQGAFSVGIGQSRQSVFAIQAQPNFHIIIDLDPEYRIAFGNNSQGEVLDVGSINNWASIKFPPNVYSMRAVLNADNTWTIQPA